MNDCGRALRKYFDEMWERNYFHHRGTCVFTTI